jgi:hypothetical protein
MCIYSLLIKNTDTDKEMPDIPKEVFKEMPEIIITENGVEKLLQNLNPNKAMWSGRVSTKVTERTCTRTYTHRDNDLSTITGIRKKFHLTGSML